MTVLIPSQSAANLSDEAVEGFGEVVAHLGPGVGAVQEQNVVLVTLHGAVVGRGARPDRSNTAPVMSHETGVGWEYWRRANDLS